MINSLTVILITAGLFFFFATSVGLLRFPDFYARMHAAGKGDTLSSLLILLGLSIYNLHHLAAGNILVSLKILLIIMFIFLASPHVLVGAKQDLGNFKPVILDHRTLWNVDELFRRGDQPEIER